MSAGTDLHERTLSIEARPLEGGRLAVHGELRDVRRADMPAYFGVSHPVRGIDGPLVSARRSPKRGESV